MSGWSFPEFVNGFKRKLKFDVSNEKKKAATFFTLKTSAQLDQERYADEERQKLQTENVDWHIKRFYGFNLSHALAAIEMNELIPQEFKDLFEKAPVRSAEIKHLNCLFGVKLSGALEIGLRITGRYYFIPGEKIEHMSIPHDIHYMIEYHYSDKGDMDYRKTVGPMPYEDLIQLEMPSWFKEHLNAEFVNR